jgi:hypothetical protein
VAVEAWLEESRKGADLVRVELIRVLVATIDDDETPSYVLPRLAAEMRSLLAELEGERTEKTASARPWGSSPGCSCLLAVSSPSSGLRSTARSTAAWAGLADASLAFTPPCQERIALYRASTQKSKRTAVPPRIRGEWRARNGRRGIEGDPPPQVPPGYLLCPGAEPELPGLLCVAPVGDAGPVAAPDLPWSTPGPCPLLSWPWACPWLWL